MDNDQKFDDTSTEEESEKENVSCDPEKMTQECYVFCLW